MACEMTKIITDQNSVDDLICPAGDFVELEDVFGSSSVSSVSDFYSVINDDKSTLKYYVSPSGENFIGTVKNSACLNVTCPYSFHFGNLIYCQNSLKIKELVDKKFSL